ncbi:MAG: hypothetical protein WC631_02460 [Candidatus Paceibacterota bacterium]|jgi:hypothetical protein
MTDRHKTRKWIKIISISTFTLFVVCYALYEVQRIAYGPRITILTPKNGSLVSESFVNILGKAENIKDISMNDRKIFIDETGNFDEKILLSYGYNLITLKASDKFNRKTEKTLEIVYK